MEVLIVGDRARLAKKLRKEARFMRVVSHAIEKEIAQRVNNSIAAEIERIAEELFPLELEKEELSRAWNLENTFVRYNQGDAFTTLHSSESHDILALSFVKFDQANYEVDVVLPEHVSRQITTKRAWFLTVEHLAQNHKLAAQRAGIT